MSQRQPLTVTVRQIPVTITASTLIAAVVLAWLFWPTWHQLLGISVAGAVAIAAAKVLIYLLSILGHEVAHAVVGRMLGRTVSYIRLTALGGVTGFERVGSKTAPAKARNGQWLVAAAGPLANATFALAWWIIGQVIGTPESVAALIASDVARTAAWLNGALAIFNAIPGLPLDGGQVLVQLVQRRGGRPSTALLTGAWAGRATSVIVLVVLIVPALLADGRPHSLRSVWAILIAMILWQGASEALPYARTLRAVTDLDPSALWKSVEVLPPATSMSEFERIAQQHATAEKLMVVGEPTDPSRWLRLEPQAFQTVPVSARGATQLSAVSVPLSVAVVQLTGLPSPCEHLLETSQCAELIVESVGADSYRGMSGHDLRQWIQSHAAQAR